MRAVLAISLAVTFGALAAAILLPAPVSRDEGPEVRAAGYFKSDSRDRVRAFESGRKLTGEEARAFFDRVTVTEGTVTRLVIYSAGATVPYDALTFAPSLRHALELTVIPPFDGWDWRMQINPAGQRSVDGG